MKFSLLPLTLCLLLPCFAAPHPVMLTVKDKDEKPLSGKMTFAIEGPQNYFHTGVLDNGKANVINLEPGYYSVFIQPSPKSSTPGKVWHGLAVSSEAKDVTNWDLKLPMVASLQGRIVRPDGTPVTGCLVSVQSGTSIMQPVFQIPTTLNEKASVMLASLNYFYKTALGAQHAFAATPTDKEGNFTLTNLVPANYALDVYDSAFKKHFTIPFAPALKADAEKGEPTKLGSWTVPENGWNWLLDNKLQHGGTESKYTGQGKVTVANGVLGLGDGDDMTGVNWPDYDKEKLPRQNYELSFDARRVDGTDFFVGLTFPYGDKPLSWIVGGWGGNVVGLSNINGFAAVENETTKNMEFADDRWYRMRLRVSKAKVEAWIDEEKVIDLPTMDKEFTIRWSVEPSLPLGFATWNTGGELRDVRIRSLEKDEIAAIEKSAQE